MNIHVHVHMHVHDQMHTRMQIRMQMHACSYDWKERISKISFHYYFKVTPPSGGRILFSGGQFEGLEGGFHQAEGGLTNLRLDFTSAGCLAEDFHKSRKLFMSFWIWNNMWTNSIGRVVKHVWHIDQFVQRVVTKKGTTYLSANPFPQVLAHTHASLPVLFSADPISADRLCR